MYNHVCTWTSGWGPETTFPPLAIHWGKPPSSIDTWSWPYNYISNNNNNEHNIVINDLFNITIKIHLLNKDQWYRKGGTAEIESDSNYMITVI